MMPSTINVPKFHKGQDVCFTGGKGAIQNYKPESGTWAYEVEMAMGQEPDFGRVGYETTVVLVEAELKLLDHDSLNYWAMA
jgi:hypothetical protein